MNKRRGFTLVEVLIAIGILAILLVVVSNLLRVPTKANQMSEKEFQVQSALRVASESVNNSVRNASAVFLLTKATPIDANEDLSEKWDYLICEERDGVSEVVHYRWMKSGSGFKHVRNVIAEAKSEKVHFFIDFETSDNGKLLQYKIMAQDIETGQKKEVSSEIKPLNSFNIVDNAKRDPFTGKKIGNALAFRSDVPDPEMGGQQGYDKITVSLVLDISGSMWGNLDGWYSRESYRKPPDGKARFFADDSSIFDKKNQLRENWKEGYDKKYFCRKGNGKIYHNLNSTPYRKEEIKIEILKKQAKALVDKLVTSPNKERIEIALYPFSEETFPDDPHGAVPERYKFKALQNGGAMQDHLIKSAIDSFVPRHGTNVGDGIRRAYHEMLKLEKTNQDKNIKNFILVLTDGAPNVASFQAINQFFFGEGRPSYMTQGGNGNDGLNYMKETATYVKSFPNDVSGHRLPNVSTNAESVDATVIGFSNRPKDNERCTDLGKAIGAEPGQNGDYYITAGSEAALDAAFSQFTDKVLDKASLWYVVSPK